MHVGAPLIPLLCHHRSLDVLNSHLENYDKGNTLKVCKEDYFFFPPFNADDEFKLGFS